MPLLLRRSAPSPSVDELAFAIPAAPLSAASSSTGSSRSASGTESQYPQLQRCSTHARMSMRRRRSTAGTEGELEGSQRPSQQSQRGSALYATKEEECASCRDSKRLSGGSSHEDERTSSSEGGYGSDAGRESSAPSCACSVKDEDLLITSSVVLIEDQQLAVVDMELRDLRKTFAKKLVTRLAHMTFTRKKRPHSTPNLLGR